MSSQSDDGNSVSTVTGGVQADGTAPRNRVRDLVESASAAVELLPANAPIREAATVDWFTRLHHEYPPEREPTLLPPLLLFLHRRTHEELVAFGEDLERVRSVAPDRRRIGGFLLSGVGSEHDDSRQWYAGLAELAVTAALLEHFGVSFVRIEPALPNGRVADAVVDIGGRLVWFEVTALTTSDAAHAAFDPKPGTRISYGDPYLDAQRFYRKAFDKIVGVDPDRRSQVHPTDPSIVVIADGDSEIGFESAGIAWATEQILNPVSRERQSRASLLNWIAHDYPVDSDAVLNQIKRLSALALACYNLGTTTLHRNEQPSDGHRLSMDEFERIVQALKLGRSWTAPPSHL